MKSLEGRVALVTGAGSGIGRSDALVLAERGAVLIVNDFDPTAADETVAQIVGAGGRAVPCVGDVGDAGAITEAIDAVRQQVGEIDILVNNAGISGRQQAFDAISDADLTRMFQVHVMGSWYCTRAVLPGMKARRRGKIINTSSILGMSGRKRSSHYAGAKAALIGLTKAWAKEFAEWNIQVNAVAPGRVRTPILGAFAHSEVYRRDLQANVPLQRRGEPEEVAWLVAFLASDEADYITGQVISPNGGEVI
ncbi:SDR family NAD(P)-dependent oxidoreductase [Ottowia pentelensis]|uniref:SDR family NAD(P)-dependent oxidoreductase n=1 Tax=Ottowia pentelensis TaxID=511108 RepID=A0ABV6PYW4_9BURK